MDGRNLAFSSSFATAGGIMRVVDQAKQQRQGVAGRGSNCNSGTALNCSTGASLMPGGIAHASIFQSLTNAAAAAAAAAVNSRSSTNTIAGAVDRLTKKAAAAGTNGTKNSGTNKKCSLPNSSYAPSQLQNDDRPFNTGRWTDEEHNRFLDGLNQYGTGNWKKITEMVGTRSCTQIRTHAQKYFIALQKPIAGTPVPAEKRRGSIDSLSKNSPSSKMTSDGIGGGSYSVSELHQHSSHDRSARSTVSSKRRKLRLTKGSSSSPKSGGLEALTGIEALARAAETESLDDAAEEYDSDNSRKRRLQLLDANDQPPYEDEAKSSDEDDGDDDTDSEESTADRDGKKLRRTVQRTSSMLGAAAGIASLVNATVSSAKAAPDSIASAGQTRELDLLRDRLGLANDTVMSLQQHNREMEIQLLTTIEEKNRAVNDCKTLQELNAQIQAEHRRALIMLEQAQMNGGVSAGTMTAQQAADMEARLAQDPQIIAAAAANGVSPQELARHHRQQHEQQQNAQNAHVVELLHAQLTEAEVRFHQVTESLTRQTQVLTDQHKAILELNDKLAKEKAARQALEAELEKYRENDTGTKKGASVKEETTTESQTVASKKSVKEEEG